MRIWQSVPVDLDSKAVETVLRIRLMELEGEFYIKKGRVIDCSESHPHNGDVMEKDIGSADDKQFEVRIAAQNLRKALGLR